MTSLATPLHLSQQNLDETVSESVNLLYFLGLASGPVQADNYFSEAASFQPAKEADKVKAFLKECTCGWQ